MQDFQDISNNEILEQQTSLRNGQDYRRGLFDIQSHQQFSQKFANYDDNEQQLTNQISRQILSPIHIIQENLINNILVNDKSRQRQQSGEFVNIVPNKFNSEEIKIQLFQQQQQNVEKPNTIQHNNNHRNQDNQYLNNIWKKNAFNILTYISSFIQLMKTKSSIIKFRNITSNQLNIIGDHTSFYNYWKNNFYFILDQPSEFEMKQKKMRQRFRIVIIPIQSLMKRIQVIQPDSLFIFIWEIILFVVLAINLFYIPIQQVFRTNFINQVSNIEVQIETLEQVFFQFLPGFMLILDILLQFNKAVFIEGQLTESRIKIAHNYFSSYLLIDILGVLPFIINQCLLNQVVYLLNYLQFFRFFKIYRLFLVFEEMMYLNEKRAAIKDMIKLIAIILYVANIICSGFFLVAEIEKVNLVQNTWIDVEGLKSTWWLENYINALYWAVITMLTIGYGDIAPTTINEKIYVIFVSFIACGVFAYSFNVIGTILQGFNKKNNELKGQLSKISNFLKQRNINPHLQVKVRKYFEYLHQENQENSGCSEDLLKNLNSSLQKEVMTDLYLQILSNKKIFNLNFSNKCLIQLAQKLKERRYTPEEIIYEENSQERILYFIIKGKIKLYIGDRKNANQETNSKKSKLKSSKDKFNSNLQGLKQTIITKLTNGDLFGDHQFFTGMRSQTAAETENVVTLAYLKFEDFYEIIQQFPEDFERFSLIKDNIILYNNTKGTGIKCLSCSNYTHTFQQCSFLKFQPNFDKILLKQTLSENQIERKEFKRREFKTETPLSFIDLLQDSTIEYIMDNNPLENANQLIKFIEQIQNQNHYQLEEIIPKQFLEALTPTNKRKNQFQIQQLNNNNDEGGGLLKKTPSNEKQNSKSSLYSNEPDDPLFPSCILNLDQNSQQDQQFQNKSITLINQPSEINIINNENQLNQKLQVQQYQQRRRSSIFKKDSNLQFFQDSSMLNVIQQNPLQFQTNSINNNVQPTQFIKPSLIIEKPNYEQDRDDLQTPLATIKYAYQHKLQNYEKQQDANMMKNFDKQMIFKVYYPHNNYDQVIIQYQERQNKLKENYSALKRTREKLKSFIQIRNQKSDQDEHNITKKNSIIKKNNLNNSQLLISSNQSHFQPNQKSKFKSEMSNNQDDILLQNSKLKNSSIIN